MKKFNQYSTYYKRQPTEELKEIAFQDDMYHEEARMAAMLELRSRGEEVSDEAYNELEDLLEKNEQIKKEQEKTTAFNNAKAIDLPEYYSPAAILGFSIFFSVIFGGILMFSNLRKAGKKNESILVLGVSFIIMMLSAVAAHLYQMNQWVVLLANVTGAIILIEYFWKKHIGNQTEFKRKSLTKAILVSVGATVLLMMFILYFFPEQFPEIK